MLIATNLILGLAAAGGAGMWWRTQRRLKLLERERFIRGHVFPARLLNGLTERWPHLTLRDQHLVARALRQWFLIHARTRPLPVAMPSLAVDELWHHFILDTRAYEAFCAQAFGSFFHHLPASTGAMATAQGRLSAMRRTWRAACHDDNIQPRTPSRLPLLFAIDHKLAIPGHTWWRLDGPQGQRRDNDTGVGSDGCGGGETGDLHALTSDSSDGGGWGSDGGGDGGGDGGCGGGCGGD
ncbi:glycine-rich domain-containing protein [Ideonella margarita]|uniref:Uncharacterized protein n=1 Tax=Ideonella margarita TaxID=2984191 RepID=A0ABU9CB67_9BURK